MPPPLSSLHRVMWAKSGLSQRGGREVGVELKVGVRGNLLKRDGRPCSSLINPGDFRGRNKGWSHSAMLSESLVLTLLSVS